MNTDMNMNILNEDPKIYTVDNMLTEEECEHFIDISSGNLKRALVSGGKEGYVSQGRSGSNTWLAHNTDDITKRVGERIAQHVQMPLENAEKFQIIYYGVSQEYRKHYDSWDHDGSEKTFRNVKYGGARLRTALVYLNDVEEGGGTQMTKLGITVEAKKGRLLVFDNVYEGTHNKHLLSEHAGMPVKRGEKYAFNLWFRECNRNKLYSDFNPSYYASSKSIRKIIITDNKLEKGDYIPFINFKTVNNITKSIHTFCDAKPFLIITVLDMDKIYHIQNNINKLLSNYHIITVSKNNGDFIKNGKIFYTCDNELLKLFNVTENLLFYVASPNRRIKNIYQNLNEIIKIDDMSCFIDSNSHIPYLIIDDVLDESLLNEILDFYKTNKDSGKLTDYSHSTKNRQHIHPSPDLESKLDNKLSRSVFQEVKKIFYHHITHRETYKICGYDSISSGRFHAHRDTPPPYQHRKYAMSLLLNDDYEGGEFYLPEYNKKIKLKKNSAIIFPGICTHQVLQVISGIRMAIITFFVNGDLRPQYKVKSDFYRENNITECEIYPQ